MTQHQKAMALSDQADICRRESMREDALRLYAEAFEAESCAAEETDVEPSRSILHRSAAWLGIEAGLYREAERIARRGLSFEGVPDELAEDLRTVIVAAEDAQ